MKLINVIFLMLLTTVFFSCDIDKTSEGEMPDIDVDVDSGKLPSFDVDWADIDVGTTTKTVKVPKIKVVMEEEEIEVPYIDVDMPDDGEKEELILVAEAEVSGESHDLDIVEVYATGKRLYVISELKATGEDLGDERMRVSDRVVLMAPDLDVKHYIIGTRPEGSFNSQYSYIASRDAIANKLTGGKTIYSK